jgi:hypothetical protein
MLVQALEGLLKTSWLHQLSRIVPWKDINLGTARRFNSLGFGDYGDALALGPIRGCCLCRKGWDLLSRELLPDWVGLSNL